MKHDTNGHRREYLHEVGHLHEKFKPGRELVTTMVRPERATRATSLSTAAFLGGLLLLCMPLPAAAYLDPISGSVILQVIAAALLAGLLSVKRAWGWVGSRFRGLLGQRTED